MSDFKISCNCMDLTQGWKSASLRQHCGFGLLALIFSFGLGVSKADTLKTLDGNFHHGKASVISGGVKITGTNGIETSVTLSNLDSVVFAEAAEVIPGERSLNFPWANQDVGNVGAAGGARQETNAFTIRASGIGVGHSIDGFHFVYQPMSGNAEIVARIALLEAALPSAQAGVMIRQTLGPESAHAAVLLSPGAPATFHYRASRKRPNPELRGPKAPPPRWLKLEKKERFYVGSISEDGINWKVIGGQNIAISPTRNRDDQWFIGLAVSSHTNGSLCSAFFDEVKLRSYGVKAEFFSDEFKTLMKSQILSKTERWEGDRPAAARWTGVIIPKHSETYYFTVEPKDASQLWLDDRLIYSSKLNLVLPMFLNKYVPYELKLESSLLNAHRPAVKLYWNSRSQDKEVVPWTSLRPFRQTEPTNTPAVDPHIVDISRASASAAGVVLKSGTLIAGTAKELDETLLKFQPLGRSEEPMSTLNIARLQFRSMSPQLAARIASAVPGVLLANGDFIEGDFKAFSKGQVTISSVIFGLRSFAAASEAVAVVLRPFQPTAKFVVRTDTGSAFFAEDVEFQQEMMSLTEPILGKVNLKAADLLDCRRLR
jgi:hypothetical protein